MLYGATDRGGYMADEGYEAEGVRILGAQEAQELTRTPVSQRSKRSARKKQSVVTPNLDQAANVELPHWSEAPTGEVPTTDMSDKPQDGWEALTGSQPRIRVDQNDWKDVDYDPALSLNHDDLQVGALGDDHISLEDNDEEFERNVAQKRATIQIGETAQVPVPVGAVASNADEPTGQQRITKISTVPDSATTEPVSGSTQAVPGESPSKKLNPKAGRRDKRVPQESVADAADVPPSVEVEPDVKTVMANEATTLITRTATAAALAAVAIVCFFLGAIPTLILAAALIALMSLELCAAFRQIGSKPAALMVAATSFFAVIAGYLVGDRAIALSTVVFFVFTSLWYLFAVVKARPTIGIAMSALTFVYVGVLGSFAGMILGLSDSQGQSMGVFVLVSTVLCVAANDTAAYLFGKFAGRTPLAPAISPNKTMEGTSAGVIAAIVVGFFIGLSYSDSVWGGPKGGLVLGALVACAAIFGDLVESMLKRDCKLKDFGSILPGHGGLMDRFDGLLFALPVAYYLALTLI
jgi:CDP-diglyceride synthetase